MSTKYPWDVHPDLTIERLTTLANAIRDGRADAVAAQLPEIGDDGWVLGCRAFQSARFRILQMAESPECGWLKIIDASRHLEFSVGDVPLRFYRGDPEEPSDRYLAQSYPELAQMSLAFPDEPIDGVVYRLAVETDFEGYAIGITFVGISGADVVMSWPIPFEKVIAGMAVVKTPETGVELDAPSVGVEKDDDSEEAKN